MNFRAAAADENGKIGHSELWFMSCLVIALLALTSAPYVVGRVHHAPGKVFSGVLDHSLDTNNYLAYVYESLRGQWLFYNPMTGEPHRPVFFNFEWLLMGKVGAVADVPAATAMDACRILFLVLMCFAVYWLASFLFDDLSIRRTALVACLAGGGFGWIAVVHLLHIPIDSSYFLDLTDANLFPFYWSLRLPHFLIAETFVIFGLCFLLRGELRGKTSDYVFAGLCYVAAGTCRPYDMLFLMASTGLYLLVSEFYKPRSRSSIVLRTLPLLISLPVLGYYYWIFKLHPIFHWWSYPGRPAPGVWLVALGFGASFLLLPFALWRIFRVGISYAGLLMLCCFVTAAVMAEMHWLFHFAFQFATNILIPMVMVVLIGLKGPITNFSKKARWGLLAISMILFVNSFTSIALSGQAIVLARRGDYDIDSGIVSAFSWIEQHAQRRDVILADFDLANAIPQFAGVQVFCGYTNPPNFSAKFQDLQSFLNPATANEFRENLLRQNHVGLVLLTRSEMNSLSAFVETPFVREVFGNDAAAVFRIELGQEQDVKRSAHAEQ